MGINALSPVRFHHGPGGDMRLTFCGATGTVTGSRYLLSGREGPVLVDCGLFQGFKQLRLRNRDKPPFDARALRAVLLTHAHLDHSGYLPVLDKDGFHGPVYGTAETRDLCAILLPDSGHLQEEDARYASRKGFSRHHPPLPLYTLADAVRSMRLFHAVKFGDPVRVAGLEARFIGAGHLLGAASIAVRESRTSVVFSGDVGRPRDPILPAPRPFEGADYLVVESTYGNRNHPVVDIEAELGAIVERTAGRGGSVLIPAFAVGRAQLVLHYLARLRAAGRLADVPVFLNSPMAGRALDTLLEYPDGHRLSRAECEALRAVARVVETTEESIALNRRDTPAIIVAASGMATGGRVLHHLKSLAPDARNSIVFTGFQAGGTRGAALVAGARETRIHGESVPVRAEVISIEAFSAHADADELMGWMRGARVPPKLTFVTHGEPAAADALRWRIERELGWPCEVPDFRDCHELASSGATRVVRD